MGVISSFTVRSRAPTPSIEELIRQATYKILARVRFILPMTRPIRRGPLACAPASPDKLGRRRGSHGAVYDLLRTGVWISDQRQHSQSLLGDESRRRSGS
jgi:hypothetical protein